MKKTALKHVIRLALILATAATSSFADSILIVNGRSTTGEAAVVDAATANLQTLHEAAGNTVTVADSAPLDLSAYSQIWDIRFEAALSVGEQSDYLTFLSGGGRMFLVGENDGNGAFIARNDSLLDFVAAAGGGTLNFALLGDSQQTVLAPFTSPDAPVSEITYAYAGGVDSKGTGQWITQADGLEQGSGVAFGPGDLANASAGSLALMFDVNFLQNDFDAPHAQNLTENLIRFMGNPGETPSAPGVPDGGSTAVFAGLVVLGLIKGRRFFAFAR
jgi:hypothetical protein